MLKTNVALSAKAMGRAARNYREAV